MGHAPTPDEKWQPSCRFSILIRSSRPKKLRRKTTSLKPLRPHELSDTDSLTTFFFETRVIDHRSWRNVVDHQIQAWYRSRWLDIWSEPAFFRSFWQPIFRNWSRASAVLDPAEQARSGQIESAPEVSWGFHLHPSGLSFGFQARCTGSTRTNKRRRFQKSSVIDGLNDSWKRGMDQEETSTTSIVDEQTSGCMVDLLNLSWAVLCGRQCDFSFFVLVDLGSEQSFVYYGGGGLQLKIPVGADNVSSMSIWWVYSQSASTSQHFFGSVVLQSSFSLSCTYALGEWSVVSHRWSRRTPAEFCIWSNQWGYFTERGRKNWTFTKSELLLHRHEATAPALAKQNLYAISMHTVHGGLRFSVQGPRATDFFLTMSLWSSKSMCFFL